MRAAVFYGGPDIRLERLPRPEPGDDQVLIRVRSAGICGSDLHRYRGADPWARPAGGYQDGHELAGEVAAVGDGVACLRRGQRVGVEPRHLAACGRCPRCRAGETHLCAGRGRDAQGRLCRSHGFSEYDISPATSVHPLPDQVTLDEGAILDCYACAVHAIHRARLSPHGSVAVVGTGAIAMAVGQIARQWGAARVFLVGRRQAAVEAGLNAGAGDEGVVAAGGSPVEEVLDRTAGQGVDTVFETVGGDAPTLAAAVGMARSGGTACVLGVFTKACALDVQAAYRRELTLVWSNSYSTWEGRSEYGIALDLMARRRLPAESLITHHYPLDRIGEAFAAAADKASSTAIKVMVHPSAA